MKRFFQQKETWLGISAAVAFQLIFIIVWLTGYSGVYERTDQFTVGIVNEDAVLGNKVINKVESKDYFKVTSFESLAQAKPALDERKIQMLIHLSDKMTEGLQANEDIYIDYYINQSTPTLTQQIMETTATKLNDQMNERVREVVDTQVIETIPQIIAAESTNSEVVEAVATETIKIMKENNGAAQIFPNIMRTNDKEGFANTMVPLLIILTSYIGAMLISQHLQFSEAKLKGELNQSALFIGRQTINILMAVIIALLTVSLLHLFKVDMARNFLVLWGFQAVLMFSFLTLSQIFVMIFGNPGMIFNIALVATQLVSSGAIVPRELLSSFYQNLGSMLPATYGVNSYFSLIYGGGNFVSDLKYLAIIIAVTLTTAVGWQYVIYIRRKLKLSRTRSEEHTLG